MASSYALNALRFIHFMDAFLPSVEVSVCHGFSSVGLDFEHISCSQAIDSCFDKLRRFNACLMSVRDEIFSGNTLFRGRVSFYLCDVLYHIKTLKNILARFNWVCVENEVIFFSCTYINDLFFDLTSSVPIIFDD